MSGFSQPSGRRDNIAKSSSYTVTDQDFGKRFTTTGATGAIVFTMPDPKPYPGEAVEFFNTVNQNMTVQTGSSSHSFVAFNDATATSVGYLTSSAKIGSGFRLESDGAVWIVETMTAVAGASTIGANLAKSAPVTIA